MKEEYKSTARPKMRPKVVTDWSINDVVSWLTQTGHGDPQTIEKFKEHEIDGKALLTLREDDLKIMADLRIGVIKRLNISIKQLQRENVSLLLELGHVELFSSQNFFTSKNNDVCISFKIVFLYICVFNLSLLCCYKNHLCLRLLLVVEQMKVLLIMSFILHQFLKTELLLTYQRKFGRRFLV